jgi:hypothetical protein
MSPVETPIYDDMLITVLEDEFEPPCEHCTHGKDKVWHSDGPAKFELIMPCGRPFKVCAQFIIALDAGGLIHCATNKREFHDKSSIVWSPL